ncbi:hypothetical protein VNO80_19115 [Phaseolus coccineus]|uniref:Trafficking protein particle complex subunit 2 n=1 Tax=Phaseolus coccineus TaxID=3886 RepID=A0AAN9MIY1_PHACN
MATTACFIIVSRNDIPIYEAEVGVAAKREDAAQLHQFILHAALDIVQDLAWTTSAMYLKSVDRFNELVVSVYVTAGHILYMWGLFTVDKKKFMLLHDSRNDDGIKSFFQDVHELYIKTLLNPLYLPGSRITSSHFDTKVRALARKWWLFLLIKAILDKLFDIWIASGFICLKLVESPEAPENLLSNCLIGPENEASFTLGFPSHRKDNAIRTFLYLLTTPVLFSRNPDFCPTPVVAILDLNQHNDVEDAT